MKTMQLLLATTMLGLTSLSFAQQPAPSMPSNGVDMPINEAPTASSPINQMKTAPTEVVDGEIKSLNKSQGIITLKHSQIKSLNIPATTAAYQAIDKALLGNLKTGDKVQFIVSNDNGKPVILDIRKI